MGATLTGITNDTGECDRCGRELGRVFEIRHTDGTTGTYGRRCCSVITGWKPNTLDNRLTQALRLAVIDERTATVDASFPGWENFSEGLSYEIRYTIAADSYWPTGWQQRINTMIERTGR